MASRACPQGAIWTAVIAAVAIRLVAAMLLPHSMLNAPANDPDAYALIAHNWATTGVYARIAGVPTAYRPPGYVAAIAPFCSGEIPWVWGILALHLLASAVTVWATARLVQRWIGRGALVAAWLVALDPILIHQSSVIMTETMFAALLALSALAWTRSAAAPAMRVRSVITGVLVFSLAMTRPIAWPIWLAWSAASLRRDLARVWLRITIVSLALSVPWVVRNQYMMGRPILTTTHGAYTLWLGQNPVYYDHVVSSLVAREAGIEQYQRYVDEVTSKDSGGELQVARQYQAVAMDWIRKNPGKALHTAAHHIATFWRAMPNEGSNWQRYGIGVYYVAVNLWALAGLWCRDSWRWPRNMAILTLLAATIVHAIYWSDMRMRGPFAPMVACLAVTGLFLLRDRFWGAKRTDVTR